MPITQTLRFLFTDFVAEILEFPVWWYTIGVRNVVRLIIRSIVSVADALNLKILFRFLLTPMFGLRDWVSRIISFGVRIVHFCILLTLSIAWTLLLLLLLVFWLILPVVVVYSFFFHLDVGFVWISKSLPR